MQASPTPYDILPPPELAFTPTIWVWLLTTILAIFIAMILLIISRSIYRRKTLQLNPIQSISMQINQALQRPTINKEDITLLVIAIKRALSAISGIELSSISKVDLDITRTKLAPTVFSVLEQSLTLDELSFRPILDSNSAKELLFKIKHELERQPNTED